MRNRTKIIAATIAVTLFAVFIVLNLGLGTRKITRRIETRTRSMTRSSCARWALLGPAIVRGNRVEPLLNGDQIFPAMLEAIRGARRRITFETFIYWSGEIGREFADALAERARAGVQGARAARLARQPARWTTRCSSEMERRRRRGRALPPAALVQPRPRSTTARTASCWWWTARSASPAASASPTSGRATPRTPSTGATRTSGSKARRWRRCRRRSWTTGSRRTRRGAARRRSTSRALAARGDAPRAGVHELARRGQREHAADVPAVDRRGRASASASASAYFVPDDLAVETLVAARRARREGARSSCPASTSTPRSSRQASRAGWGPLLRGRRRDLRVPADDVPLQGDGRRRAVDLGRLDQLRQPLLPPQRRGQPQRLRRDFAREQIRAFEADSSARAGSRWRNGRTGPGRRNCGSRRSPFSACNCERAAQPGTRRR